MEYDEFQFFGARNVKCHSSSFWQFPFGSHTTNYYTSRDIVREGLIYLYRGKEQQFMVVAYIMTIVVVFFLFINLLSMVDRLVAKKSVAI